MALIIKGDMPAFCECLNKNGDMEYCRFACVCESHNINTMARPFDCPIIGEIPDEHGRLVDADKFRKEVEAWRGCHTAIFTFVDFLALLDNAPTIVEATEIHTAPPTPIKRESCRYYAFSAEAIPGEHEYCLKKGTYNFECSKVCPYRELVVEASK